VRYHPPRVPKRAVRGLMYLLSGKPSLVLRQTMWSAMTAGIA
jgi:hypothetical protein